PCVPTARLSRLTTAVLDALPPPGVNEESPIWMPSTKNRTEPVGAVLPLALTVAVNVINWLTVAGFADVLSNVDVPPGFAPVKIGSASGDEVLAAKVALPRYCAVSR